MDVLPEKEIKSTHALRMTTLKVSAVSVKLLQRGVDKAWGNG